MFPDDNKENSFEEKRNEIIDLTTEVKSIVDNKIRIKKNVTPEKFMTLVSTEMGCVRKCNRVIRKIEKYLCSDEFIFALEPKDLINLLNSITKSKYASLGFLTRLYDISTKNEILRTYFQDTSPRQLAGFKQSAKTREIVNELKRKAREVDNDVPPQN